MDSLVSQIKTLQRSDAAAKKSWWEYCDHLLNGIRDPAKHEASTLEDFLSRYNNGTLEEAIACAPTPAPTHAPPKAVVGARATVRTLVRPTAAPAPISNSSLAECIKSGQRHSSSWKTAWQTYCTLHGSGMFDPSGYDEAFITSFLDYLGGLALTNMGGAATVVMATSGVKRQSATVSSMPAAKRQCSVGSGDTTSNDPEKARLVDQIKALQRSDNTAKEAWWNYCDTHHGCIRDPSRHESYSLVHFLNEYGASA
mmetsp:Transcript_75523/g.157532  ORF Transcript_75523/g.157532 Transcript_75523/m.157532 type:complete len:255 (+) Transcript_75523:111-875(+)